jgi:hypothetical protein
MKFTHATPVTVLDADSDDHSGGRKFVRESGDDSQEQHRRGANCLSCSLCRYRCGQLQFQFRSGTGNGAFIWNSSPDPGALTQRYGLALQNVGTPQFPAWDGFVQATVYGPNPCAFADNWAGATPTYADLSAVLAYVATIPAKGSKTVTLSYVK